MLVRIDSVVAPVQRVLSDLGTQLRALNDVGLFGEGHETAMLQQLEAVARRALTGPTGPAIGVGAVWETGNDAEDARRAGMLWWLANGGDVTRKIHVDNPLSDSFYDFTHSEWYERAIGGRSMVVVGPFIDAWGTDDHTLTAALVVLDRHGGRLGVAAADLDVAVVTSELASALGDNSDELVLVNDEDRVVAAKNPLLTPGLRLEPFLASRGLVVSELARTTGTNWRVVRTSA